LPSQETLGEALGITFQQVQKYEKGTNRISASRMQQIANVLQVSPVFFFEGLPDQSKSGDPPTPNYAFEMLATKDGVMLMEAFVRIKSVRLKRAIVHLIEELEAGAANIGIDQNSSLTTIS
jgi:transcriptional regulator with XRE-family HTH domain